MSAGPGQHQHDPAAPGAAELRSRYVTLDHGVTLHVVEAGPTGPTSPTEPPMVLVHGLASNARLWDGVALALAAAGHRVVAVDLRGHGRSDKPDDGYDLPTVAGDVAALIAALGLQRPLVAGQSWGGNVVVELAWAAPDCASAIVCVDGGTIHLADRFATFEECWAALAPPRFDNTSRTDIESYLRRNHPDWPETGITGALACFDVAPDGTVQPWLHRDRHKAVLAGMWDHAPRSRFAAITTPVLFVPADSGDATFTAAKRAAVEEAVQLLPRAGTRWFSPADHDVHAQFPTEVAAVLADFARSVAQEAR